MGTGMLLRHRPNPNPVSNPLFEAAEKAYKEKKASEQAKTESNEPEKKTPQRGRRRKPE